MFLTNDELNELRNAIESQTTIDDELLSKCGNLLHLGAYDEAVRSAFVLLEERLREMMGKESMTGADLASAAFNSKDGPLSKLLGKNLSEREGLRELYSGAFKVFRNPSAHSAVGYDSSDGKEIVSLVNLLLRILKQAEQLPHPGTFPANLESALQEVEAIIGASATSRLRVFLGDCMDAGLEPASSTKQYIAFQTYALFKATTWKEYKLHKIALFYLVVAGTNIGIQFPINYYYSKVEGFNTDVLDDQLSALGFYITGRNKEFQVDLKKSNSEDFFSSLFDVVYEAFKYFEDSITRKPAKAATDSVTQLG
jgi:uncharacterized protein (TIGR02391 family)